MKNVLAIVFLLTIAFTYGQDRAPKVVYAHSVIENNAVSVKSFIESTFSSSLNESSLSLISEVNSLTATHYFFQQQYEGIDIAHATIKLSVAKDGKVIVIYNSLVKTKSLKKIKLPIATQILEPGLEMVLKKEVWIADNDRLTSGREISVLDKEGRKKTLFYNVKKLVSTTSQTFYFAQDSLVSGKVFNPDPLTSSGNVYGGLYRDFGGIDTLSLNNQRQTKQFTAYFDSSIFELKNQYLQLEDLNGDGINAVVSTTPFFDFTRAQNGFEDVNAFYHISYFQSYVKSLGFNHANSLARVDPHGTAADNSYFSTPNTLYFGTGGVDDAEDADVLIHEYCHFVSFNAAPQTNIGNERNGIDEGSCDYLAAAYSKAINPFKSEWIYNWDGHNEFWTGRVVNTTRKYPQDRTNNIYKDGEMWSSTLMQINEDLGRGKTDSLILETMSFFAPQMTYSMVANVLLLADTLLFNGANFCSIYKHLYDRGYLPLRPNSCGITGINEIKQTEFELRNTANGFELLGTDKEEKFLAYSLFSMEGKLITQSTQPFFTEKEKLSPAIYLVHIKTNKGKSTLKWWSSF